MSGRGDKTKPGRSGAQDRQARSAAALRDNLKRRKDQRRARLGKDEEKSSGAGEKNIDDRST